MDFSDCGDDDDDDLDDDLDDDACDGGSPTPPGGDGGNRKRRLWKAHRAERPPEGAAGGLYACDQCEKTFGKQSSLARHKYEHSGRSKAC